MDKVFIAGSREYCTIQHHVNAPLFRKVFDWPYEGARLEISAVGFYRVFLNGKEITKGFFAPYISNPDHYVYYDEYELKGLKKKGNVLCVLLGNGFGNAKDNGIWDFEQAPFRSAPKLYLGIYAGDTRVITTDESFMVCDSPITFDDLRCGERYDARTEHASVLTEDCKDVKFRPALKVPSPKGEYKRCEAQPILPFERFKAKRILKGEKENCYIYDFGQVNAGVCTLKIDGKAGQIVDLYFGEMLDGNQIDLSNISFDERSPAGYVQHDQYICAGGRAEYTPSFTYHGFRYVQVEGITKEQANKDLLEYVVLHSAIPVRGHFACGDEVINRIQECTIRSDLSNFHYFPTDCPQREKNGWTADASLSAEQMLYSFDVTASLREWLHNIRKTQTDEGMLPGIIPTTGWGYEWGNGPAWDSVLIELPYQIFRFTENREIIKENAEAIIKYFAYLKTRCNEEGLLAIGLGDWCEAGTFNEWDYTTPLEVSDTLVTIDLAQKAACLLQEIGRGAEVEKISAFGKSLKEAFVRKYVEKGRLTVGTQTGLALALKFGIFEGADRETAYTQLKDLIAEANGHFKVGVIGVKYLFDVLSEFGDAALAYQLITKDSFPSYAYNLKFGATTLWEAFQEFEEGTQKMTRKDGGTRILSFNHHFWGSVSAWFYRSLAGLNLLSARKVEIAPDFIPQLPYAEADYRDGDAKISVRWEWRAEKIMLKIENVGFDVVLNLKGYAAPCAQKTIGQGTHEFELYPL